MEADKIKKIIESVSASGLTEFVFEDKGICIKLSKTAGTVAVQAAPAAPLQAEPAPAASAAGPEAAVSAVHLVEIKSPLVGVYYESPKPGAPAFVKVGSKVKKGKPLCIVEAMKLMNEITAESDCEVVEILAENGTLAEYGKILFKVKPL